MAKRTHNIAVATGKYTKDGEEKTRWLTIGGIIRTDKGKDMIKMDALPTTVMDREGNTVPWDGWCYAFAQDEAQSAAPTQSSGDPGPSDDLGF